MTAKLGRHPAELSFLKPHARLGTQFWVWIEQAHDDSNTQKEFKEELLKMDDSFIKSIYGWKMNLPIVAPN